MASPPDSSAASDTAEARAVDPLPVANPQDKSEPAPPAAAEAAVAPTSAIDTKGNAGKDAVATASRTGAKLGTRPELKPELDNNSARFTDYVREVRAESDLGPIGDVLVPMPVDSLNQYLDCSFDELGEILDGLSNGGIVITTCRLTEICDALSGRLGRSSLIERYQQYRYDPSLDVSDVNSVTTLTKIRRSHAEKVVRDSTFTAARLTSRRDARALLADLQNDGDSERQINLLCGKRSVLLFMVDWDAVEPAPRVGRGVVFRAIDWVRPWIERRLGATSVEAVACARSLRELCNRRPGDESSILEQLRAHRLDSIDELRALVDRLESERQSTMHAAVHVGEARFDAPDVVTRTALFVAARFPGIPRDAYDQLVRRLLATGGATVVVNNAAGEPITIDAGTHWTSSSDSVLARCGLSVSTDREQGANVRFENPAMLAAVQQFLNTKHAMFCASLDHRLHTGGVLFDATTPDSVAKVLVTHALSALRQLAPAERRNWLVDVISAHTHVGHDGNSHSILNALGVLLSGNSNPRRRGSTSFDRLVDLLDALASDQDGCEALNEFLLRLREAGRMAATLLFAVAWRLRHHARIELRIQLRHAFAVGRPADRRSILRSLTLESIGNAAAAEMVRGVLDQLLEPPTARRELDAASAYAHASLLDVCRQLQAVVARARRASKAKDAYAGFDLASIAAAVPPPEFVTRRIVRRSFADALRLYLRDDLMTEDGVEVLDAAWAPATDVQLVAVTLDLWSDVIGALLPGEQSAYVARVCSDLREQRERKHLRELRDVFRAWSTRGAPTPVRDRARVFVSLLY